jgi:hypothetical protein
VWVSDRGANGNSGVPGPAPTNCSFMLKAEQGRGEHGAPDPGVCEQQQGRRSHDTGMRTAEIDSARVAVAAFVIAYFTTLQIFTATRRACPHAARR